MLRKSIFMGLLTLSISAQNLDAIDLGTCPAIELQNDKLQTFLPSPRLFFKNATIEPATPQGVRHVVCTYTGGFEVVAAIAHHYTSCYFNNDPNLKDCSTNIRDCKITCQ